METKLLAGMGLTQGEIKTYLALLKLGESSTGKIAKESGVSRSKLYIILDKLEKKGIASHIEKNGVAIFQAAEPGKIKDYLKERQAKLKELEDSFEKFLPQLEAYHNDAQKVQNVTVYQGLKGLITVHEHTYLKLKRGEYYYYLGVPAHQPESQHFYWKRDHLRRSRLGIKTRILFNADTSRKILENRNSYKGCDARYMPRDIKTPAYFLIYRDTVMIALPSENPIAIEIVSQEIADAFMAYFNAFWSLSKKLK